MYKLLSIIFFLKLKFLARYNLDKACQNSFSSNVGFRFCIKKKNSNVIIDLNSVSDIFLFEGNVELGDVNPLKVRFDPY